MPKITATCPVCHKPQRARFPKGGDGTALIILKHSSKPHARYPLAECPGSFATVDNN